LRRSVDGRSAVPLVRGPLVGVPAQPATISAVVIMTRSLDATFLRMIRIMSVTACTGNERFQGVFQ
jgi:hypothetical protein